MFFGMCAPLKIYKYISVGAYGGKRMGEGLGDEDEQ